VATAATQTYDYVITHSRYGKIGTYDRTIDESGGMTHALSRLRIAVKMLGMIVHRENADQSETWRGKRLVAFHSVTTSNGKPMTVSGEARANEAAPAIKSAPMIPPTRGRDEVPGLTL